MRRRLVQGVLVAAVWTVALAAPVFAHGDHDARPIIRNVQVGPYTISLWQVYPETGSAMTPHVIVMFDGRATTPPEAVVTATVNSTPTKVWPSTTTRNGLETADGVAEGDVVTVTVSDGTLAWDLGPIVVPPAPTSMIPMPELIYSSIFLTVCTAWWVAGRTARAWRKPALRSA